MINLVSKHLKKSNVKKIFAILFAAAALCVSVNASAQSTEWRAGIGYASVSFNGASPPSER